MFTALVLVRNIQSSDHRLDFGEFAIEQIGARFEELRDVFSSLDVNPQDWILEKSYALPPPGSPVDAIPDDVEQILLLLRLYRAGDISFIKQAIVSPNRNPLVLIPSRAMNDLNSYSLLQFPITSAECLSWQQFANIIRRSPSWTSDWFMAARRFFLTGGAKPFKPQRGEVDRILDYATASSQRWSRRRTTARAVSAIAQPPSSVQIVLQEEHRSLYS